MLDVGKIVADALSEASPTTPGSGAPDLGRMVLLDQAVCALQRAVADAFSDL